MEPKNDTSTPRYADCAVAFLDIVGFTEVIHDTIKDGEDETLIAHIARLFDDVRKYCISLERPPLDFYASMLSDAIVISLPDATDNRIRGLAAAISYLQCSMIHFHCLLRGSIAAGRHYQSGAVMFGPAMLDATKMEKVANWPRIIMTPSAFQRLRISLPPTGEPPDFLRRGNDGLWYVDYLAQGSLHGIAYCWANEYLRQTQQPDAKASLTRLIADHEETIRLYTNRARDPKELTRCHALANYHNRTVNRVNAMLARTYEDTNDTYSDLDYLSQRAAVIIRATRMGTPDEEIDSFMAPRFDDLRNVRSQLSQFEIHLPTSFPTLYGLPPNG
jgi:hypothetical protein